MDIQALSAASVEAVRFRRDGRVLTLQQFSLWLKVSTVPQAADIWGLLESIEADPVYAQAPPAVAPDERAEWDGAVEVEGQWRRAWKIVSDPARQEADRQAQLADIRRVRNGLLASSDWTQFNDSPLSPEARQAWAAYRQSLRDITKQDVSAILWPDSP